MIEKSLAPGLLLAMPQLADPNFKRAVVLMIEHDDNGSFGLVINRPSNGYVADLLKLIDVEWSADPEALVGVGGPVMTETAWLVHGPRDGDDDGGSDDDLQTHEIAPGISLSNSKETFGRLAKNPPRHFRLLVGYAGWGPGQLAEELEEGAWLQSDATPDIVFATDPSEMWERALKSVGVDPNFVAPSAGVN